MLGRHDLVRRGTGWAAIGAWLVSTVILGALVGGAHDLWRSVNLYVLTVAATCTVVNLVGGILTPIEKSYDAGYTAGWGDCYKTTARPTVVPEERLAEKREQQRGRG